MDGLRAEWRDKLKDERIHALREGWREGGRKGNLYTEINGGWVCGFD